MHGFDPTASLLVDDFPVSRLGSPVADVVGPSERNEARRRVSEGLLEAAICEERAGVPSLLVLSGGDVALSRDHVVSGTLPAADAISRLDALDTIVVMSGHGAYSIVTRGSLNTVVARAWLFGLVTLLEIKLRRAAEMKVVDWRAHVSPERLAKAREIKEERARRGQAMETIDGLQFSDLGSIALKDEELFSSLGLQSKRAGRQFIKRLESLRNNLAHAQDLVKYDWDTIVMIARNARRIVAPSA
jgi:hypothetical protein